MSNIHNVIKLSVQVSPNATRDEIVGFTDGVLQVRVSAPPVKGKANKQLIALLSRILEISKSRLSIVKGHTAKSKIISISGLSQDETMKRLSSSSGVSNR